nr:hypothetical protein [Tanacetum cinerariifolium]
CGGIVRGGLCLPCDLIEKNLYNCDPNAYSFNNSNYFSQPHDDNYLSNLCGNNSHDGYDCQQQFPFVYEHEPSYNQNYDDNYYPHESLSFSCCDYCGGSHETFQCQPNNQNVDFSGSDQIQTPQYPDVNPPSSEISNEEIFQAKGDLMKSIQTILERFNCIPFKEKPQILFQTWETFFAIQCSQPEDLNELFQKLLKYLKELAEYDQSTSTDRPIFLNDNEDHPVQNKESPENSSEENDVSKTNQEPTQDSDIHQLIEECSVEVPEQQKQKMEDTMFELVKICQEKEFLCIYDDVYDLIESALESKLLSINSINSQRLDKKEQEVKNVEEQPAGRRNQPEHLLSMRYEHLSITPETESDEVTESNAENLLPIPKIPKSDFDFEEEIRLIENLLYDNSFPRPPEELNAEIADTIIESILLLPIPVQDGNSQQEEIDIVTDDVLPPSDDNDDDLIIPRRLKHSCVGYCPGFQRPLYLLLDFSLGMSVSMIYIAYS